MSPQISSFRLCALSTLYSYLIILTTSSLHNYVPTAACFLPPKPPYSPRTQHATYSCPLSAPHPLHHANLLRRRLLYFHHVRYCFLRWSNHNAFRSMKRSLKRMMQQLLLKGATTKSLPAIMIGRQVTLLMSPIPAIPLAPFIHHQVLLSPRHIP